MRIQPTKRIARLALLIVGGLLLVALMIGGWAGLRWRAISDLSRGIRSWDVAPAETVFFYHVPDVPQIYRKFLRYHTETLAFPVLVAAREQRARSVALVRQPLQSVPEGLTDLMKASGKSALFDYFAALLPPRKGESAFSFLVGGRCLSASLGAKSFERTTSEAGWSWRKGESSSGDRGTRLREARRGEAVIWMAAAGDWLLIGDQREVVAAAAAHAVGGEARNGGTLGLQDDFRDSREATLREAGLWIYANPTRVAEIAAATGVPEVGRVFREQLSGLRAASWGWHTGGAGSAAYDLVGYLLDPAVAAKGKDVLLPLDEGAFDRLDDQGLVAMGMRADWESFKNWGFIDGERLDEFARAHLSDAGGQRHSPLSGTQPVWREVRLAGEAQASRVEWRSGGMGSGAEREKPTDAPAWIKATDQLPGPPQPFFEARLHYRAIIEERLAEMRRDWPAWRAAGEARGWPMPETAPEVDVERYFAWVRAAAGFEGDHLCFYNSIQLMDTGSTVFTTSVTLTGLLFPQALRERFDAAAFPFARVPGQEVPRWANAMDVTFTSGLLLSPILMGDHGGNVGMDLLMLDFLATGPKLEAPPVADPPPP